MNDLSRIAVLTDDDLWGVLRRFPGQSPICARHDDGTACYSAGRLEEALGKGLEVYVVSARNVVEFDEHDDWWRRLVKPENVFDCPLLEGRLWPWQRLYARFGIHDPGYRSVWEYRDTLRNFYAAWMTEDIKGHWRLAP